MTVSKETQLKLTNRKKDIKCAKINIYLWSQQSSMLTEQRILCIQGTGPTTIKSNG